MDRDDTLDDSVEGGLGAALREHRARLGLTQRDLAELAGVSERTVRSIEQGHAQRPREASVRQLRAVIESVATAPADTSLAIDVLGPLTVHCGDDVVAIESSQQRTVLGLLALHPGQQVPKAELVESLWGHEPPATHRELLHSVVSRLRRTFGTDVVHTQHGGYRLGVEQARVDLHRFDDLVARARAAADPAAALELLGRALACWRGPVLADLPDRLRRHPAAAAASARQLSAVLTYADTAVELGEHERAVAELRALAPGEPLHEGLHARLMLTLAAGGQQAAALTVFVEIRDRLAEELAVKPGKELRDTHVRVLRGEVPAVPFAQRQDRRAPAQLPGDIAGFSGRADDLARLDRLLDEHTAAIVVAGTAGMGKTALAVRWAHGARARFPDGQLFTDLRGFHPSQPPLEPRQVLGGFLRALGVDPHHLPYDTEERAALFRSTVAGRRVLIVLDNAASADQVRPLLPGSPTCMAVATSRDRLGGLVAVDGAASVVLDALSPAESMAVLEHVVGRDRVAAEAAAAAELTGLCGYLPLALRVAAGKLALRPLQKFAEVATQLGGRHRLSSLAVEDDRRANVRAAFDLSYSALGLDEQRLLRRLGLVPGPDFTAHAAECLLATGERLAADLLDRLVTANLVERPSPGRFRLHDLVRVYAADRCRAEDSSADAHLDRLLSWYLTTARAAAWPLYGHFRLLDDQILADPATIEPVAVEERAAAWRWLEAEQANLSAAVHTTSTRDDPKAAWLLADATTGYFMLRPQALDDWVASTDAGLRAAIAGGDSRSEAAMRLSATAVRCGGGDLPAVLEESTRALELSRRAGWRLGEARALTYGAQAHVYLGEARQAVAVLTDAVPLSRELGAPIGVAHNLIVLGIARTQLGELTEAAESLREAIAIGRSLDAMLVVMEAQHGLGRVYLRLGLAEEAERECAASLTSAHSHGARHREAMSLAMLAEITCARGDHDEARTLVRQSLTIAEESRNRVFEADALAAAGRVAYLLGDLDAAVAHLTRALTVSRAAGLRYTKAEALASLAAADPPAAANHARAALALAEPAGYRLIVEQARTFLT